MPRAKVEAADPVAEMSPEDLAELAALEAEAVEAAEAATPAADPVEVAEGPPTSELLLPVISMAAAGLAPAWKVEPVECEQLAEVYGDLVDKYWPAGVGSFGPELTAAMVTAAVFMPRIGTPRYPPRRDAGEMPPAEVVAVDPPAARPADVTAA